MRHFISNGTEQCQNDSSNLLTPYRKQPRPTRIVVTYPRPAFSEIKRTNHAPINFDQQAQVSQGPTSYRNKEFQLSPGSSRIELHSNVTESGACPPDRVLPGSPRQCSLPLACRHLSKGTKLELGRGAHLGGSSSTNHTAAVSQPTG